MYHIFTLLYFEVIRPKYFNDQNCLYKLRTTLTDKWLKITAV